MGKLELVTRTNRKTSSSGIDVGYRFKALRA